MQHDAYSDLIAKLARFSESDLDELRSLITSATRRRHLLKLLENLREMRKSSLQQSAPQRPSADMQTSLPIQQFFPADDTDLQEAREELGGQKDALSRLLNKRELFPRARDAILAVNRALGFNYKVADFEKKGRAAFIDTLWARLSEIPDRRRRAVVRELMERAVPAGVKNDAGYQKLFNILVRDERRR